MRCRRLDLRHQKGRPPRRTLPKLGPPSSHPLLIVLRGLGYCLLQNKESESQGSEDDMSKVKGEGEVMVCWEEVSSSVLPLHIPVGYPRERSPVLSPLQAPPTGCSWNGARPATLRLQALPLTARSQPFSWPHLSSFLIQREEHLVQADVTRINQHRMLWVLPLISG